MLTVLGAREDQVESVSLDGAAVVSVHFTWDVDPERKYDQVVREVNAIRGNLPAGLARLDIQRARTTEVSVVQVALTSDTLPMRRLEKVADHEIRAELFGGHPAVRGPVGSFNRAHGYLLYDRQNS